MNTFEKRLTLTGEWGEKKAQAHQHYLGHPYFAGTSNELALRAVDGFTKGAYKGILFLHGEAGVGKTHLVLRTAQHFHKEKHRIYCNTVTSFIDDLKAIFSAKKNVRRTFEPYDCVFIDELQTMNIASGGILSSFFDILDLCYAEGKNLILSSEYPLSSFGNMPQRTISRIQSGFTVQITLPDAKVKRQYIDYFWQKYSERLPEESIQIIIERCEQIREILSVVNILQMKDSTDPQTVVDTLNITKRAVQRQDESSLSVLKQMLMDYYGLVELSDKDRRRSSKVKTILYYIYQQKADKADLRKELDIEAKRHKRMLELAPKFIGEIQSPEILRELRKIRPI